MTLNVIVDSDCMQESILANNPLRSEGDPLLNLLLCLGYNAHNPPFAALLARYYQLDGAWVIASPVHWQASHNNASIDTYGPFLAITEHYFERFATQGVSDACLMHYHNAFTWLLSIPGIPAPAAEPVHYLPGKPLMSELSKLDTEHYWSKFLTECQMWCATQHDVAAVNGVWVWGGAPLAPQHDVAVCVDAHFLAWAQCCSSRVTLYHPELSLSDFSILMVQNLQSLSAKHQQQVHQMTTKWYWNDVTYQSARPQWFIRLWRQLTHAH